MENTTFSDQKSNHNNFTIDDLNKAFQLIEDIPPIPIGIVCNSYFYMNLVNKIDHVNDEIKMNEFLYSGISVYLKESQIIPYKVFYNHDKLIAYLKIE